MHSSKIGKFVFVVFFIGLGVILLLQSAAPAPETTARHRAVQQAYSPEKQGDDPEIANPETEEHIITYGLPVSPTEVDTYEIPSRRAEVDVLKEAYEAGQFDFDANEGPTSMAVFQNLVEESLQQGIDPHVQTYEADGSSNQITGSLNGGASFKAIDYTQSWAGVPPDPDIMVGKDHIVVGVNTSFQIFNKQGQSLYGPTLYKDFWGSNCGTGSGVTLFDPFSQYDEENGRYILGITAYDTSVNSGNNGWVCIAVSKTDSAVGQWWLYSFDGNPGSGTDYFLDYPHLGVGQDAIYLSANMFDASFVRNHIFAYEKDAMYAGQSASFVKFNEYSNFTWQPAKLKGYNTGGWPAQANEPHFFVASSWGNSQNHLSVLTVSDPWQNPQASLSDNITVNSYSLPVNQPQFGGSDLQGNDNRLLDVEYWNGKLWATHTIGCNPGSGTVNCIRWYEIDISSGTPSLVQQGTFASNGQYRSFPNIGVNACGDMLLGYTKMSSSIYPGVYVAGREESDLAGQLQTEELVHAGEAVYTAYDSVPRRWGDYSGMALDPDGKTFWYVGEYSRSQSTARWSTWVSSHSWSGCDPNPLGRYAVYLPTIIR